MSQLAVPENQVITQMINTPHFDALPSDKKLPLGTFTPTDEPMKMKFPWGKVSADHKDLSELVPTDLDDWVSQHIETALEKVRVEAEEERRLDPELDGIPEGAYQDVERFLKTLHDPDYGTLGRITSLADIMPLDNGEIGIEWRKGQKIFTLSFSGDGHIVFAGIFNAENHARGILTFSTFHLIAIIGMIVSVSSDYDGGNLDLNCRQEIAAMLTPLQA